MLLQLVSTEVDIGHHHRFLLGHIALHKGLKQTLIYLVNFSLSDFS